MQRWFPKNDFQIVRSQKGNPKLIHQGFEYIRRNPQIKTSSNWLCKNYNVSKCKVRCIVGSNGILLVRGLHNHEL